MHMISTLQLHGKCHLVEFDGRRRSSTDHRRFVDDRPIVDGSSTKSWWSAIFFSTTIVDDLQRFSTTSNEPSTIVDGRRRSSLERSLRWRFVDDPTIASTNRRWTDKRCLSAMNRRWSSGVKWRSLIIDASSSKQRWSKIAGPSTIDDERRWISDWVFNQRRIVDDHRWSVTSQRRSRYFRSSTKQRWSSTKQRWLLLKASKFLQMFFTYIDLFYVDIVTIRTAYTNNNVDSKRLQRNTT